MTNFKYTLKDQIKILNAIEDLQNNKINQFSVAFLSEVLHYPINYIHDVIKPMVDYNQIQSIYRVYNPKDEKEYFERLSINKLKKNHSYKTNKGNYLTLNTNTKADLYYQITQPKY